MFGVTTADLQPAGEQMLALAAEMFPWHRSITGSGLRQTLGRIAQEIPLSLHEVPSGTAAFDFKIPLEWTIRDAYVANSTGQRMIDYHACNLHVVNNSQGVRRVMTWNELQPHLHSLPEKPAWIPYRTAYFRDEWGFCLAHHDREKIAARGGEQRYTICIDAEHRPGSLTYGECFLPGETEEEVLLHAHICHPSLANDNLSGIVVAVALVQALSLWPRRRYGYRFVFAPATIGAIAWLSRNAETLPRIRHGLVLALLGDSRPLTYKRSQQHNATIDWALIHVLSERGQEYRILDFEPWGYDERQFCSPGIDLPMGRLSRSTEGEYAEYHSSADNLSLLSAASLAESLECLLATMRLLEDDVVYQNKAPRAEPQLGRRGLYSGFGTIGIDPALQQAVLWVLNQSQGTRGLREIAQRSGISMELIQQASELLLKHDLLRRISHNTTQGRGMHEA